MIGIFSTKRFVLKILVITLLITITTSATSTAQGSQEDLLREDMKRIAEAYASYAWLPTHTTNIEHDNGTHIHTPDGDTNIYDPQQEPQPPSHGIGWWHLNQVNHGVPYFWGGSTAIRGDSLNPDANFGFDPIYANGLYFDQLIAEPENKAAGNINTKGDLSSDTTGVDCVGFINDVWRIGVRAGMSATSGGTRPMRFEYLRLGDVLLRYVTEHPDGKDHVMLFEGFAAYDPNLGFIDYDPTSKQPVPNQTMVKVYEASASYGRVHEAIWIVRSAEEIPEGHFQTHKLTLQRIAARLGNDTHFQPVDPDHPLNPQIHTDSWAITLDQLRPRTIFEPRDIIFVIDRSGSMGDFGRIDQAKAAAKRFIDYMKPGDRIGVISFAGSAKQEFPAVGQPLSAGEIDAGSMGVSAIKTAAKTAIDNITLGSDGTTIGGGLLAGQQMLDTSDPVNRTQVMILLSDGGELSVSSPRWIDVRDRIKVPVRALSIGSAAPLLLEIAMWRDGGGWYGNTPVSLVQPVFQSISADTYREKIIKAATPKVSSGGTDIQTAHLDSTVEEATFSITWLGSDLDLTLVHLPDGHVIDPSVAETDPKIEFVSGSTYEYYKISAPQKGEWQLRVFGKDTSGPEEDYSMVVSAADARMQ